MRIGRVDHGGSPRAAVIDGDTVRVLAPEVGTSDLLGADGGERDRLAGRVETEVSLDQAALLAPVEPPTIRDSHPPLGPGDVVSLHVEGIGILTNTVVAGVDLHALPRARAGRRAPRSAAA